MKSYKETTDRIFEKSERIRKKRNKAAAGILGILLSGAVLLTLTGTLSHDPADDQVSSSEIPSASEAPDARHDSEIQYGLLDLYEKGILFNDQIRPFEIGIPERIPDADDEIPKTPEELLEYYGTDIYPKVLPERFGKEMIADAGSGGHFSVYWKEEWGIYYDVNTFIYTEETAESEADKQVFPDHNIPAVKITVNKYTCFTDFNRASCLPSGADLKISVINGKMLELYRYENADGMHYTAYLWKDDVNFIIFGDLITEEEFIALLEGYLSDQQDQ